MREREQLEKAIAFQESLRGTTDDAIIDATIAALQKQLAELDKAQPMQEQRKLATVLFADVSGFTVMSETMDAEDVNTMMNTLWAQLDRDITVPRR